MGKAHPELADSQVSEGRLFQKSREDTSGPSPSKILPSDSHP